MLLHSNLILLLKLISVKHVLVTCILKFLSFIHMEKLYHFVSNVNMVVAQLLLDMELDQLLMLNLAADAHVNKDLQVPLDLLVMTANMVKTVKMAQMLKMDVMVMF